MPPRPSVVLTRPQPEALRWQHGLQAQGITTALLPLIEIAPLRDVDTRATLRALPDQLPQYDALMFVSANAVRFFLATPGMPAALAHAMEAGTTRCWAPGPGTRQSLEDAGLPAHAIDSPPTNAAQFDSESLWRVVAPQASAGRLRVLIVRGASQHAGSTGLQGSGREWLAQQLQAHGAQVAMLGVYQRQCPEPSAALRARIRDLAAENPIWLFSSSEAIGHLQSLAPQLHWSAQRALTTHPRITHAACAAGFGLVRECKPALMDVCASIESWT